MKIAIIVEQGKDGNWGAYAPDFPVAVVATSEAEANSLMREALELYFADLREKGLPIPAIASSVREIEVTAV